MPLNWYLPQMNTTLGGVGGTEPRFGAVSLWRWATMPLTSWPAGASHSSRKIVKSRDFGLEPVYCSWWPVLDAGVGREVVDADELSTNLSGLNLNGMESSVHVVGIMPLAPARSAATDVAIEAASSSRPPPPPPGAFLSMAFSSFNGIAPMAASSDHVGREAEVEEALVGQHEGLGEDAVGADVEAVGGPADREDARDVPGHDVGAGRVHHGDPPRRAFHRRLEAGEPGGDALGVRAHGTGERDVLVLEPPGDLVDEVVLAALFVGLHVVSGLQALALVPDADGQVVDHDLEAVLLGGVV